MCFCESRQGIDIWLKENVFRRINYFLQGERKDFRHIIGKSDLYMREGEEVCDKPAQDNRTRN